MHIQSVILCLVSLRSTTWGCGVGLHSYLAIKALEQFKASSSMSKHLGYLLAGSYFPDWQSEELSKPTDSSKTASSIAHSPVFLSHALAHYRSKYAESKQTDAAKNLLVFILGIASHLVSDIFWHGASSSQAANVYNLIDEFPRGAASMVQTVAAKNIPGSSYADAHVFSDLVGDFALIRHAGADWINDISKVQWKVPMDDLSAIYKRVIPKQSSNELPRKSALLAGILSGSRRLKVLAMFKDKLYNRYARRVPILVEHLKDHPVSGTNVMIERILTTWKRMSVNDKINCQSNANCLSINKIYKKTFSIKGEEGFGHAMVWEPHGSFLIISAPAAQIVYLYGVSCMGSVSLLAELYSPYSSEQSGGYGESLALVDLDGDGRDDLVVTIPRIFGVDGSIMSGLVIYYDIGGKIALGASSHDLILLGTFDKSITGAGSGQRLFSLDLDSDGHKDLVICSPFAGEGSAINNIRLHTGRIDTILSIDWKSKSKNPKVQNLENLISWSLSIPTFNANPHGFDWFGYSVDLSENLSKGSWNPFGTKFLLAVGAPGLKPLEGKQDAGGIFIWRINRKGHPSGRPVRTAIGTTRHGQFGKTLEFLKAPKKQELLTAAPTEQWGENFWMAGCVRKVIVGEGQGTSAISASLPLICGTESSSLLGHAIVPFLSGTFLVGAPFMGKNRGAVFIIQSSFSHWRCFTAEEDEGSTPAMFGSSIIFVEAKKPFCPALLIVSLPGAKKINIYQVA